MKQRLRSMRAAAAACAIALLFTACTSTAKPTPTPDNTQAGGIADGTYTASAQGKNGPVTVSVSFSDSKITGVEVGEHSETQGLYEPVFSQLPDEIVTHQTVNVDAISGSTYTSNALIEAVKDCITQAGGEVSDFMAPIEKETSTEVRELSTQVVVIGAGASGLSAALQAQEEGLSVIVLEKNASTAASASNLAAGLMAVGSRQQEEQGISYNDKDTSLTSWEDMVDKIFTYWTDQMSWHVNQKLVHNFLAESGDTADWLVAHGFQFIRVVNLQDGKGWYHANANNYHLLGKGKYSPYAEAAFEEYATAGGQIYYDTKAESLITDEQGAVTGVTAVMKDGTTLKISAQAVILCTGGFGSDTDYVYNELNFPGILEGAGSAGTGDGMRMAWQVGAQKYKEDALLVHHLYTTEPNTDLSDFGNKMNCILNYIPSFLNLNPVGTRYRNEDDVRCGVEASESNYAQGYGWNVFTQDMVDGLVKEGTKALGLPDGLGWVPLSFGYQPSGEETWDELPVVLERMEKEGVMVKADTLEELAQLTGMDYDTMCRNIEEYNQFCADGEDRIYHKDPDHLVALEKGPYYAMKTVTRYITSIGGLKVDENLSVLNDQEQAIPGLYAAGCDAAGVIYGDAYVDIEGAGFAWAFTSGRMAARSAAQKIKN